MPSLPRAERPVTDPPAATSEAAIEHFRTLLAHETDCWDVHSAIASGDPGFVLLDVRAPELFAAGHLPQAVSLPLRRINERNLAAFAPGTLFVVYCAGPHCNGADRAALRLARLGRPVKKMLGGITGWKDEGFRLVVEERMASPKSKQHEYAARLIWDGNLGTGTSSYASYGRRYRVAVAGKPELAGTADPAFRGEADRHNPEDLFLASIAACHMLTYLALCAREGVQVVAYEDEVTGVMTVDAGGGGRFESITLRPRVTVAGKEEVARAERLHAPAHEQCFIASSCGVPIHHEATVEVA